MKRHNITTFNYGCRFFRLRRRRNERTSRTQRWGASSVRKSPHRDGSPFCGHFGRLTRYTDQSAWFPLVEARC